MMDRYLWLLPLIFIFHDMEEIIGMRLWLEKNRETLGRRFPFILKRFRGFSTEGFALGVFEELVVCILLSAAALYAGPGPARDALRCVWLGAFMGVAAHFIVHTVQAAVMRGFVPALITSVICLPPSVLVIIRCLPEALSQGPVPWAFIALGAAALAVNLLFAWKMIRLFTEKAGIEPLI